VHAHTIFVFCCVFPKLKFKVKKENNTKSKKENSHSPQSTVHSPPFHVPRSTFHVPRSTFHVPRSTFHVPQSTFHVPRSTFHIPYAKKKNEKRDFKKHTPPLAPPKTTYCIYKHIFDKIYQTHQTMQNRSTQVALT
jgi:hypothetical protein